VGNYVTEMCSGSEAGSYLRLIDFVHHSTLGLSVIKKKKKTPKSKPEAREQVVRSGSHFRGNLTPSILNPTH